MIFKPYQILNLKDKKFNFFLLYGQNDGQKNDIIDQIIKYDFTKNIYRYEENDILSNFENFLSELLNRSFFEDKKIIIISRVSEKIYHLVDSVRNRNVDDIKIIINSKPLDKKSKLRSNFEKESDLVCIPFYSEDNSSLANIANNFFKEKKIAISREMLNLLVERCRGDRINLKNELLKIESFALNKKKISIEDILKLTNLSENYSFSELADACLSKNKKKTFLIINENNFSSDDCVVIIRFILNKAKRIYDIKMMEKEKNVDECLANYKPPIFWKDKETVRQQTKHWSLESVKKLIMLLNDLELSVKKHNLISVNILNNFILEQVGSNN